MEIKNEDKFSDFSKSIEQLDKQDLNLSNDIDLLYKEMSKIESSIKSFDVSQQIKDLKSDIENIQLQKGEKGESGKDGINGKDGNDGKDGLAGIDGLDGKDGKDGENGSPDTPEQIVEKINTLENVIERKTIKGLDNLVDQTGLDKALGILDQRTQYLINRTVVAPSATTWSSITGTQSDVNVGGFTNDVGYLTSTDLTGYVPTTRTLTINGTTYDLTADRTWSVGTVTSVAALTLGTTGTDLSSTVANSTTTPVITLNVPTASALNRGALSSTDWSTFNSKESALTFSTGLTRSINTITNNLSTGISGGQSVIGGTASGNNLTLSSTSNATKGKILFGNSAYDEVNNRLGINTTTPLHGLDVKSNTPYNRILGSSGTGLLIGSYTSSEGAIWDGVGTPTYTNYILLTSSGHTLLNAAIDIRFRTNNTTKMIISAAGKVGIGIGDSSPSAFLHLPAGTATANTAPLKFTSGTNLTTPEAGVMEYDGTSLFFTPASTRYNVLMNGLGLAGGQTVVGGTASGNNLTLSSTSNATKGKILFGDSAYDEVNNRLGVGTTTPNWKLHVAGTVGADNIIAQFGDANKGVNIKTLANGTGLITSWNYVPTDPSAIAISAGANFGFNGSPSNFYGMGLGALRNGKYDMWFQTGTINGGGYRWYTGGTNERMTINKDGKVGIGTTTPTALLMLAAGTATAGTAPLKFTTGTNLTTAEVGAIEYNNTFHVTNSDATRRHVATAPNTTKVTTAAPYTNDGYITINIGGTDFKVMTTA